MSPPLIRLAGDLITELRQRYHLWCLLIRLRDDPRSLGDLGISYPWLAEALWQHQRRNSPLRHTLLELRDRRTRRSYQRDIR